MTEEQLDLLAPHQPDEHFVIRESARAKHMAINVGAHGVVEVVVPRHTRPKIVQEFVAQHRQWIDRALSELEKDRPPIKRAMPDVIELAAIDRRWTVQYGSKRLQEIGGTVHVPAIHEDRPQCRQHLQQWLKNTAREHLVPRLNGLAEETGFHYKKVQVRGQRTRWGSYSSSGTLSLNYCLLFLQPELVKHLMMHELCHTREMSHSRRFWRLLGEYQPDFRSLERRLDGAWIDVPGWVGLH
ncbi:MAG: M48 family metallopeptidase [Gammaproteobacteria bacterium]|nr:M48 family metallopeptidase [Gammaproteobacteria bacterium]MDH3769228.1 M48 family metallopeptidase [Gammaproteobacteria bacterium]